MFQKKSKNLLEINFFSPKNFKKDEDRILSHLKNKYE